MNAIDTGVCSASDSVGVPYCAAKAPWGVGLGVLLGTGGILVFAQPMIFTRTFDKCRTPRGYRRAYFFANELIIAATVFILLALWFLIGVILPIPPLRVD
jgi:hypothetical protein